MSGSDRILLLFDELRVADAFEERLLKPVPRVIY